MNDPVSSGHLSVVMPLYNESATLNQVLERVLQQSMVGEVILVDDGSTDGTLEIARRWEREETKIKLKTHTLNQGKGAALRTGFQEASRPYVIVQDADLEYDPGEYHKVIGPIALNQADVVYGSRYLKKDTRVVLKFWHTMGNRFLTLLSNMISDLYVTDMETCYKGFRREVIQAISIRENGFGFEPEVTAKIARMNLRVMETAISYRPRTYDEGKKIRIRDGIRAVWCIIRYNLLAREEFSSERRKD
jgi:glycosyltransferase involved in cell wall biosynthesis